MTGVRAIFDRIVTVEEGARMRTDAGGRDMIASNKAVTNL